MPSLQGTTDRPLSPQLFLDRGSKASKGKEDKRPQIARKRAEGTKNWQRREQKLQCAAQRTGKSFYPLSGNQPPPHPLAVWGERGFFKHEGKNILTPHKGEKRKYRPNPHPRTGGKEKKDCEEEGRRKIRSLKLALTERRINLLAKSTKKETRGPGYSKPTKKKELVKQHAQVKRSPFQTGRGEGDHLDGTSKSISETKVDWQRYRSADLFNRKGSNCQSRRNWETDFDETAHGRVRGGNGNDVGRGGPKYFRASHRSRKGQKSTPPFISKKTPLCPSTLSQSSSLAKADRKKKRRIKRQRGVER